MILFEEKNKNSAYPNKWCLKTPVLTTDYNKESMVKIIDDLEENGYVFVSETKSLESMIGTVRSCWMEENVLWTEIVFLDRPAAIIVIEMCKHLAQDTQNLLRPVLSMACIGTENSETGERTFVSGAFLLFDVRMKK